MLGALIIVFREAIEAGIILGIVLAVTLPVVMEFNYLAEPDRFVDVARALGESVDHLSRLEAAARAVAAVRNLARDVGIPATLSAYGLREEHVRPVVDAGGLFNYARKTGMIPK